ncbi:hypothetical protein [Paenibacillus paridis]|uniref:hypothetical protein n=1 Tax=Paenibacillus paridis TaxID=2583376 RepID=UPI00111F5336|nr:hypothetical protein [Paenibacillus paridis]
MDILYKKIQQMRQRPGMYIGKKSLLLLHAYLNGYIAYHNEINKEPNCFFLAEFQEYIQRRFNLYTTHSWADIIISFSLNDEEAFDRFYQLLDDFSLKVQSY